MAVDRVAARCQQQVGNVDVESRYRVAAGDQRDVQALADKRARQGGRPLEMTDAEQVLDVEDNPAARHGRGAAWRFRGRFMRSTDGVPSGASRNR